MEALHDYQMVTILLIYFLPFKVYSCVMGCQCFEFYWNDGIQLNIDCKNIIQLKDQFNSIQNKRKKIELTMSAVKKIHNGSFESFENVTYFSITAQKLESFDKGVFNRMVHLEELLIQLTMVRFLNLEMFASLQRLTCLTIVHNLRLKLVGFSSFPYLPNLHSLDLTDNLQLSVNNDLFKNLSNLKVLKLDQISIDVVNSNLLSRLTELEELSIARNKLTNIDETSFKHLLNLKKLDLSDNPLRTIHKNLFSNLTHLKSIRLSHNQITAFPKSLISNCMQLEDLDISDNMIKLIENDLFHHAKFLKNFNVNNNRLSSIPSTLFLCSRNLKVIDVSFNDIKFIPEELFQNLKVLQYLRLSGNKITFLHPSTFLGLVDLKFLSLENNKISFENFVINHRDDAETYLQINNKSQKKEDNSRENNKSGEMFNDLNMTFSNYFYRTIQNKSGNVKISRYDISSKALFDLPKLEDLQLNGNNISFLPRDIFSGLKELTVLDLNDNRIKSLDNQLQPLRMLGSFFIRNNDLTTLSSSMFSNLKHLGVINMENNKIDSIHHNVFSTLDVRFLYLAGNNLQCSCYILRVVKNACFRAHFDCILQESRTDASQLSCNMLTSKWQRLLLSSEISDTSNNGDFSIISIINPGNEFSIIFNLKRLKDDKSYNVITSRSKNSNSSNKYIHISETNGLLSVSINQSMTSQKYISPSSPNSDQFTIKVIHENDSFYSRLSVFVNEKVVDSVISYDAQNQPDMKIKVINGEQLENIFCSMMVFTSRCAYSNASCVTHDWNNDTNVFCSDIIKQRSNDMLLAFACIIFACTMVLISY